MNTNHHIKDMEALGRSFGERALEKVILDDVIEEEPEDEVSTQLQADDESVTRQLYHLADKNEIDAVSTLHLFLCI